MAELDGGAVAELHGGAVAELHGGAVAELHGGVVAELHGDAVAELHGDAVAELHGGVVAELHGGVVAELHGKELYTYRNQVRSEFATRVKLAYWKNPESKIPKVDFEKTHINVNHTNVKSLLSLVINSIEILPSDPTKQAREYSQLSDEQLSSTSVYLCLKREMEQAHTSTKNQIQEWIGHGKLVSLFETYFDEHDEEHYENDEEDIPNELKLLSYQRRNPIQFKWMWIIYKAFRKETRPRQPMCDCCHNSDEDDEPKLTFAQYFRDSRYEFYTQYTKHRTYYYNIVDFLRLVYRAILEIPDEPAPETQPMPEPTESLPESACEVVAKVPLVTDEELLAKIAELKVKYPDQTSIKSLCKLLKHDKPEWQVTETRLKKLPKANKSSD